MHYLGYWVDILFIPFVFFCAILQSVCHLHLPPLQLQPRKLYRLIMVPVIKLFNSYSECFFSCIDRFHSFPSTYICTFPTTIIPSCVWVSAKKLIMFCIQEIFRVLSKGAMSWLTFTHKHTHSHIHTLIHTFSHTPP